MKFFTPLFIGLLTALASSSPVEVEKRGVGNRSLCNSQISSLYSVDRDGWNISCMASKPYQMLCVNISANPYHTCVAAIKNGSSRLVYQSDGDYADDVVVGAFNDYNSFYNTITSYRNRGYKCIQVSQSSYRAQICQS